MEKRKIVWMILTSFAISLVIVAGTLTFSVQNQSGTAQEEVTEEPTTKPLGYRIQITNGQLSLYREGSGTPYQVLDMPLNLLSEYDIAQLEEGITVETEAEMRQLVEDLTS